jgi:hypothetical protein
VDRRPAGDQQIALVLLSSPVIAYRRSRTALYQLPNGRTGHSTIKLAITPPCGGRGYPMRAHTDTQEICRIGVSNSSKNSNQ